MRVSIARALVTRPAVLLMDEPFAALDEITRLKLNDDLAELQSSLGATVVFVTHSVFESVYLADRIVVMAARPGRAVAEITVEAPAVRREGFRLTAGYAETCRRTSAALHVAMGEDAAERAFRMTRDDIVGYAVPAFTLGLGLLVWEGIVRYFAIPPYLLPAPSVIITTLFTDWPTLSSSLWVTLSITLKALLAAVIGSVALAIIFAQSRLVERAFYPFAVAMQVTPIVAIAPLLLIYLTPSVAVLVCAFLVAFFPLLANTTLGLSSADHNLVDLFRMYRATRFQQFMLLRLPSALPYFLAGLRISGGLALIGAIVAEIAAGSAGQGSGLAYRIVEFGISPQYSENVRRAPLDLGRGHHNSCPPHRAVALALARTGMRASAGGKLDLTEATIPHKNLAASTGSRAGAAGLTGGESRRAFIKAMRYEHRISGRAASVRPPQARACESGEHRDFRHCGGPCGARAPSGGSRADRDGRADRRRSGGRLPPAAGFRAPSSSSATSRR